MPCIIRLISLTSNSANAILLMLFIWQPLLEELNQAVNANISASGRNYNNETNIEIEVVFWWLLLQLVSDAQ